MISSTVVPRCSAQPALFPLSHEHRRYILTDFAFGAMPNAVISAGAAYLIFGHVVSVPVWGKQGIAFDLALTVFFVTLIQLIVCTLLTRKRVVSGAVPAIAIPRMKVPMLRLLPHNVLLRGSLVAILATALTLPLSIAALSVFGIDSLNLGDFVAFKAAYGPAVALVTAPLVYLAALTDTPVG